MTREQDVDDDDGSSFHSQASHSYNSEDDEDSTFFSRSSAGSMDSIDRTLVQLEENDEELTELTIHCERYTAATTTADCLGQSLPKTTHLKKLSVYCGGSSKKLFHHHRQTFRKICRGLQGNSSVESIEIHDAEIDSEVARWLLPSFAIHKKKNISMTNCGFVGSGMGILLVAMGQNSKCIRQLAFRSCTWEEYNSDMLASSLPFMALYSLSLVNVNVSVEGWTYLFRSFASCRELIQLDLSRNELNADNIRVFMKCLAVQKSMSMLSLSACGLDDECLKELMTGLRTSTTLTDLDISKNSNITDKGVVYLRDLLKHNNSIVKLNVDGCRLSKQSLNAIESGLRYNNSFLKSFFSEKTSQAIFGFVDTVESIDIAKSTKDIAHVFTFDSEESPNPRKKANATNERQPQRNGRRTTQRTSKSAAAGGERAVGGDAFDSRRGKTKIVREKTASPPSKLHCYAML